MKDSDLEKMTLDELRDLKTRIEDSIRAAIRNKRQAVAPVTAQVIDLEQSRDAWLKAKSKKSS